MASAATQSPFVPSSLGAQSEHYTPHSTKVASAPKAKPRDVQTTVNYHKDNEDGSPPHPSIVGKPETYDRPTLPKQVVVHDIRGSEDEYTLDGQGFQIYRHVSAEKDFVDEEQIKSVYYPETEELLKKATGASKVFIFDHTIRREPRNTRKAGEVPDPRKPISLRGPVQRVHIDQSYIASKQRVSHHLPADAPQLLQGRYQIINVWRPIKPILKDPLAVAEAGSVREEELVGIKLVYPDREGETFGVRPGEHRWRYLHGQTPEEVLLIKCFDSKVDGSARRVPHTAFVDAEYEEREKRESIEVRALVFHEDDVE